MHDHPIPDPTWDYSTLWHLLQNSKADLDALLSYMATVEEATDESDRQTKERLESTTSLLREFNQIPEYQGLQPLIAIKSRHE